MGIRFFSSLKEFPTMIDVSSGAFLVTAETYGSSIGGFMHK
jgi:hypothetical protein